jgi:hypothetical protein
VPSGDQAGAVSTPPGGLIGVVAVPGGETATIWNALVENAIRAESRDQAGAPRAPPLRSWSASP